MTPAVVPTQSNSQNQRQSERRSSMVVVPQVADGRHPTSNPLNPKYPHRSSRKRSVSSQERSLSLPSWAHVTHRRHEDDAKQNHTKKKKNSNEPEPDDAATTTTTAWLYQLERILRTHMYHWISQMIDDALQNIYTERCFPIVLQAMNELLNMVDEKVAEEADRTDNTNDDNDATITTFSCYNSTVPLEKKTDGHSIPKPPDSENEQSQQLEQSFTIPTHSASYLRYDPRLLPLLILKMHHTCPIDLQTQILHHVRMTRSAKPRACVVWLSTSLAVHEIWKQCWYQQNQIKTMTTINSKHCRRPPSDAMKEEDTMDCWVDWAQHHASEQYDEIIIYVSITQGDVLYTHQFAQFLNQCTTLRALHGIPMSIVLATLHGQRRPIRIPTSSSILVRQVTNLPSSQEVLQWVLEQLDHDATSQGMTTQLLLPSLLLPAPVRNRIWQTFRDQNRSVSWALQQYQRAFVVTLTPPLSVWCMAHIFHPLDDSTTTTTTTTSATTTTTIHQFLTALWYQTQQCPVKSDFQLFATWLVNIEVGRRKAHLARLLLNHLCERLHVSISSSDGHSVMMEETLGNHGGSSKNNLLFITLEDRKALLSLMANALVLDPKNASPFSSLYFLDLWEHEKQSHAQRVQELWKKALYEMIILLDHCLTVSDVEQCLQPWLREAALASGTNPWQHQEPSSLSNDWDREKLATLPQIRRDVVASLLDGAELYKENADSLFSIPGWMYCHILDRICISERDWFETCFGKSAAVPLTNVSIEALWDWFCYGIRHLKLCGLIRSRRGLGGKKSETFYEKTALVWCGGD